MIKIDLHTHSINSPDGSITAEQYTQILNNNKLDCIAITDHNSIDFALKLQEQLGSQKIIVGEEINTKQGEIIGLFLNSLVKPDQEIEDAINDIKSQGGIVYVPHPFETFRSGVSREVLDKIEDKIDIVESANGRAFFQNLGPEVHSWAHIRRIPSLASSDAHRVQAITKTYSVFNDYPTAQNIVELSKTARKFYGQPSLLDILAPKLNRIKKTLRSK